MAIYCSYEASNITNFEVVLVCYSTLRRGIVQFMAIYCSYKASNNSNSSKNGYCGDYYSLFLRGVKFIYCDFLALIVKICQKRKSSAKNHLPEVVFRRTLFLAKNGNYRAKKPLFMVSRPRNSQSDLRYLKKIRCGENRQCIPFSLY